MIKSDADLDVLASLIFNVNTKEIYINGVLADDDDYVCLLNRLKAGNEVMTGFLGMVGKIYIETA